MKTTLEKHDVKVADEVWLATANLHHSHPERFDFSVQEIREEVARLNLVGVIRPGVQIHLSVHCIANKAPNPGRYRMLMETTPGRRRLYREGDSFHSGRARGKITPAREEVPAKYRFLLDWYCSEYSKRIKSPPVAGTPGWEVVEKLRGLFSQEDAREMMEFIRADERIDHEDW